MAERRRGVRWGELLVTAALLAALPLSVGQAQQARPNPGGIPGSPLGPDREDGALAGKIAAQQARSQNTERQKRLVSDTEKLLSLATELKQEVGKTDKNMLSVDVVKKADEIEKLAHSVKEHMKG